MQIAAVPCAETKLACVAVTTALATALAVFALIAIVNKQQPSGEGLPAAAETSLRGTGGSLKFRLGFDKNIGLPDNIAELVKGIIGNTQSYRGKELTVSATGYTNVQGLYNRRAEFDFLFIPAGVLPYLDKYTVLATSRARNHLCRRR